MFFEGISWAAVIVSAILATGLGFVWYSPYLFGSSWIREMGSSFEALKEKNKSAKSMSLMYSISFVGTVLSAYMLAAIFNSSLVISFSLLGILSVGFFAWLGFMAPVMASDVIYGGKSWKLFAINAGYQLAAMLVIALVVGIFG